MAKQYSGPNTSLIKGAAAVYRTSNPTTSFDFKDTFEAISSRIEANKTAQQNAIEEAEKEANEAYSVLNNISFEGILPNMHMATKDILGPLAKTVAENRLSANNSQNRDEKNEFSLQANMAEGVLKNVVSQLKDLSENAKEQLDFNRSQDKSAANDPAYISAINKIFSGVAQPQIIDNELAFIIDGKTYKYSQLKNISPKAKEEYISYSDSLSKATSATTPLKQPQVNAYQTKVTGMITPDNIVSLGMDDFGLGYGILGDQFESIQDWQAFVDKDYQAAKKFLAARLTENYVTTYNNSAAEYQRLNPPSGGGVDPKSTNGFLKNTQQDIDLAYSQYDKVAEIATEIKKLKDAGKATEAFDLQNKYKKGFLIEFYASDDQERKAGRGRKSSYYIRPVINETTGDVEIVYKSGSGGDESPISREDFEREMAGTAGNTEATTPTIKTNADKYEQ